MPARETPRRRKHPGPDESGPYCPATVIVALAPCGVLARVRAPPWAAATARAQRVRARYRWRARARDEAEEKNGGSGGS